MNKVYSISDLHLPGGTDKNRLVFGPQWQDYLEILKKDWKNKVSEEDIVLLPGDYSWALHIEDVKEDLSFLETVPGYKVLIRGNHDYWWNQITKVRSILPSKTYVLQNDALVLSKYIFCGTRLWKLPGVKNYSDEDNKIYLREIIRLKLSLEQGKKFQILYPDFPLIVLLHFPPFNYNLENNEVVKILESYHVNSVVYGHIHHSGYPLKYSQNNINYYFVSCDQRKHQLQEIK